MGASCCKIFSKREVGDSYATIRGNSQQTPDPVIPSIVDQVKFADHPKQLTQGQVGPNPEERRRKLAEAAEARRKAEESRGVKNVESVRRAREKQLELERLEEERLRNPQNEAILRWQVS